MQRCRFPWPLNGLRRTPTTTTKKKEFLFFYPIREKIDTRETKTRKINTTRESNWIAAVGETDHDASKWWNVADNRGRWTYNNNNNKNYKNDARLTTATAKKTATMTTTTTTTTTTDQDHHDDCDNNLLVLCWFIGIEICIAFSSRLSCICSRKKNEVNSSRLLPIHIQFCTNVPMNQLMSDWGSVEWLDFK